MDKKNQKILSYCLSQIQCVKNFLKYLCNTYGPHIINGKLNNDIIFTSQLYKTIFCHKCIYWEREEQIFKHLYFLLFFICFSCL